MQEQTKSPSSLANNTDTQKGPTYVESIKEDVISIFLSSDEKYSKYMLVTILSIVEQTRSTISFTVLDGGITQPTKEQILQLIQPFTMCI